MKRNIGAHAHVHDGIIFLFFWVRPANGEIETRDDESKIEDPLTATNSVKTPRRNISADEQVLRGAVAFVDVHTTEGEDASGIFVELLSQMGAKCVKIWTWNPRASHSPDSGNSKVGITHVVFKDGGIRTLEKVRQAGDLVKCVGVGWVLEYVFYLLPIEPY